MSHVTTAVLPVAGLGTRFLPASKATPKVLLPILDRPLIQYAVDEAFAAGIESVVFVMGRGQGAIVDYFDMSFELETKLRERGKDDVVALLEALRPSDGHISYVRQTEPLGLGHAVWCARDVVGDEPFAVLLPDELIVEDPPSLSRMIDVQAEHGGSVVLVDEVDPAATASYGIVTPAGGDDESVLVSEVVEKPRPEDAASNLALVGRYVLDPVVMDTLGSTGAGSGGEIQLTDAINASIATTELRAVTVGGERYDCGSKAGFLDATVNMALKDPELAQKMRDIAQGIVSAG
ncbi:MAG: UTP--glucose-1-phosphate uridylyltransferase [Acidimicrobiia bacterium]